MGELYYFFKDEDGQGLLEYGLILGLLAMIIVVALVVLGPEIADLYMINQHLNET